MMASEMLWPFTQLPEDYVVLDTETTGLFDGRNAPDIISVGIIKVVNRTQVHGKEFLIRPCLKVSSEAFSIHGISNNKLESAPTFEDAWKDIFPWLENELVVMHNAAFDWRLILNHVDRYNKSMPKVKGTFCSQKSAFPWAETNQIPMSSRGPSLDTLTSYFKVENLRASAGRHGALLDAKQTALVIEAIRQFACASYLLKK